ncbi:MAG TPA: TlpA disulfide reductase family protein [Opitutaceae bacterium]|nr:TlpA disulfide reductase family protein [Opitutaceae bacterium]
MHFFRPTFVRRVLCLAGLSVLPFAAGKPQGEPAAPAPPTAAPAWKLRDLDGQFVDSAQFKGKVVVLDFWATWCPPCLSEIPGYIALQEKYGQNGLTFVGVSLDSEAPEAVKQFVAQHHMNYPVVLGDESITAAFGGVEAIPTTFIIDRQGIIRYRKVGAEKTADFEQRLLPWLK